MKKLFTILAVAAAVVACQKNETIALDNGEAISFASFVNNSTRADAATDPSYSTTADKGVALTKFNVYGAVNGVNIFNGNEVTKGTAAYGDPWALTGAKQYWIAGADYKFVGVVDGNKTGVTTITPDAAGLPESINYTVDGETDLLCDVVTVNDVAAPYSVVTFNYTHLLSKVKFSVTNTTEAAATNYRIVLTEAKITGVYASGSYNVNSETWTLSSTREYVLENLTVNSAATQYHSSEVLLIPGNNVGVVVKAEVQATDNDGAKWTTVSTIEKTFNNVLGDGGKLTANNAYHFAVSLGIGSEIQFTAATMPEWADGDGNDDTVLQ